MQIHSANLNNDGASLSKIRGRTRKRNSRQSAAIIKKKKFVNNKKTAANANQKKPSHTNKNSPNWGENFIPKTFLQYSSPAVPTFCPETLPNISAKIFFTIIFNDAVINLIVFCTDKSAKENMDKENHKGKWTATTATEILIFLAMCMLMGIRHLPKISDYWQQQQYYFLIMPAFSEIMPQDRWFQIYHFLCAYDEDDFIPSINQDMTVFSMCKSC